MPRRLQVALTLVFYAAAMAVVSPVRALSIAEYWQWDFARQRTYLMGVHQGFLGVALTTDDNPPRTEIRTCLSSLKTDADIATAFHAWVQAHPETMSREVPPAYVQYLFSVCPAASAHGR